MSCLLVPAFQKKTPFKQLVEKILEKPGDEINPQRRQDVMAILEPVRL